MSEQILTPYEQGFAEALARWLQARKNGDREAQYHALREAAWWAEALAERLP